MEEQQGVNPVEAETTPAPTENNEQPVEQAEASSQPGGEKDYKAIAEQLSRDIKEKNRKLQEQKKLLEDAQTNVSENAPVVPVIEQDETVKRFLETEANARLAVMMQTDPSVKDRAPIILNYVKKGYDITMADKLAKADIMDQILTGKSEAPQPNIPKQMTPAATPEAVKPQPTGNDLDDIISGKIDVNIDDPDGLREVLKKYRPA